MIDSPWRHLRRHPDFRKFWIGQTASLLGSQVTYLALPVTAALILQVSVAEMGVLVAAETLPLLLVSLPAGVWVDRLRRRPILMLADAGRALLLGSIPLAAFLGVLRLEQLYLVAFLTGALTVIFNVAYEAYLPSLLPRERLPGANRMLYSSDSLAQIAGPGLAGVLIQGLTAPIAIAVDAASYLISVASLALIGESEPSPVREKAGTRLGVEIGHGLRMLAHNPLLRPLAATGATINLFGGIFETLLVLYVTRDLGLPPLVVGSIYAVGSFSALLGTVLGGPLTRRAGVGPTIVLSAFLNGVGWMLLPLAGGLPELAIGILWAGALLFGIGSTTLNLTEASLIQAVTPNRLLGRVNASRSFLSSGMLPVGAVLGGILGSLIGVRATLLLAGVGLLAAFLWAFFSPLRTLRTLPLVEDEPSTVAHDLGRTVL